MTTAVTALNTAATRMSPRRSRLLARSLLAATIVDGEPSSRLFRRVLESSLPHAAWGVRPRMEAADAAIRRRFRATCAQLERAGAAEDTAQLVGSLVLHLEQRRHARIEQHELVALCGVLSLIDRNMAERAAREGTLAEAVG